MSRVAVAGIVAVVVVLLASAAPVPAQAQTAPALSSAEIDGGVLELNFNNALDAASGTAAGAFAIKADGSAATATAISIAGRLITLTVPSVSGGQTVTVTYTKPGTNPLKGANQVEVAGFTDQAVTNNTPYEARSIELVGNHLAASTTYYPFDKDRAQGFTTGSDSDGYRLTSVQLGVRQTSSPTGYSLRIISATSSGAPSPTVVGLLAPPPSFTRGFNNTFTGGIDLDANTKYFVYLDLTVAYNNVDLWWEWHNDNPGAAKGWSIEDGNYYRKGVDDSDSLMWQEAAGAIVINGYSKGPPVLDRAEIDGATLVLDFHQDMYTGSGTAPGQFKIQVNGGAAQAATAMSVSGKRVTLNVPAVTKNQTVTVSYSKPTTNPLKGDNLKEVATFSGRAVTHYASPVVTPPPPVVVPPPVVTPPPGGDPPVVTPPPPRSGGGGGGGGGPSPSTLDFEWTVKRDIEALARGNDTPTGAWSDGTTLWIADNGQGADDEVYAYDLESGERVEDREFALAETNRAPRGFWSDGKTVWVSDSGRDHVFAYDLASGERLEAREVALATVNPDARGIWSDGVTIWVLDGRANALFAYDLASGRLLAHYELDGRNGDPRGIWSDGVTVWVSDHGAKMLFAYRLPQPPRGEVGAATSHLPEPVPLVRVTDEEFDNLSGASNNSPRGIWSDGDVMYVVDASDGKVYTYNMPDAIDARLASLSLSGIEIGAFASARTDYDGTHGGITVTTVQAEAMQRRTTVVIAPPDADAAVDGHQVALDDTGEVTVTVTSADGSRTRVYRVGLAETQCLRGAVAEGFSLLVYEGGNVDDLDACARSRAVVALYALHESGYVAYIPDAPEFVNGPFRELFAGGVLAYTPLLAASSGPPSADPAASANAGLPWAECLRGAIADGFSAAVYEGGSVEALDACARARGVAALYALGDGGWVSYVVGGTESVNRPFAELFPDGVPAVTPLVVRRDGPPAATAPGSGGDN